MWQHEGVSQHLYKAGQLSHSGSRVLGVQAQGADVRGGAEVCEGECMKKQITGLWLTRRFCAGAFHLVRRFGAGKGKYVGKYR